MRNIFFIILFILTFFNTRSFALEGEATTYQITITRIEICDSTSTDASCNNPIVLYSGNSGSIDIASTSAGAAPALMLHVIILYFYILVILGLLILHLLRLEQQQQV